MQGWIQKAWGASTSKGVHRGGMPAPQEKIYFSLEMVRFGKF